MAVDFFALLDFVDFTAVVLEVCLVEVLANESGVIARNAIRKNAIWADTFFTTRK